MTDELERNRQAQKQRERERRILSAREHIKSHAALVDVFSNEAWAEVEKEIANEN